MNFLPILMLVFLMGGEKISALKEFLLKIDFASFTPIFTLLGIDKKTVDFICSENFENLLNGNADVSQLVPLLSGLFSSPQKNSESETTIDDTNEDSAEKSDYFSPIKNVAPTDVEETLSLYTES